MDKSMKTVFGVLVCICLLQSLYILKSTDMTSSKVYLVNSTSSVVNGLRKIWLHPENKQSEEHHHQAGERRSHNRSFTAHSYTDKTETDPEPSDLMIISYMRSGSSFTGRMLGYGNDTFYFFEPLWKLSAWGYFKGKEKVCVQENIPCSNPFTLKDVHHILESSYNCNITRTFMQAFTKPEHISNGGPHWAMCKNQGLPSCYQHLRNVCLSSKHRVTKVLRMTADISQELLKKFPKLKVIHLVRDPRAIIYSRITTGWYNYLNLRSSDTDMKQAAKGLCGKMRHDMRWSISATKQMSERVKVLQYEDILLNPDEAKPCIFSYIGMDLPQTADDIQAKAFAWQKNLSWNSVKIVDEECKDIIDAFGYKQFNSQDEFRNASKMSYPSTLHYRCKHE